MSGAETDPGHEQVTIELEGRRAEVDAGIAPLVLACWREGLETLSSCEEIEPGRAFVTFPTREQAERFAWLGAADALTLQEPGVGFAVVLVPDEDGKWSIADDPGDIPGMVFLDDEEPPEPPRMWTLMRQRGVEIDASGHGSYGDDEAAFVYSVAFPTDDLQAMLAALVNAEAEAQLRICLYCGKVEDADVTPCPECGSDNPADRIPYAVL